MLYSLLSLMLLAASAVHAQTTGNITYVLTPVGVGASLPFQCSNGLWTIFGLSMNVQVYVNGVGPNLPMAETGLPTIQASWFINGVAAPVLFPSHFGVATVSTSGNSAFFALQDDQNSIGGTFQVGTCTQGQALPSIKVALSSNTFIVGQGFTTPPIPAVSGIPNIVNNFPVANNAGGSVGGTVATSAPTAAVTAAPTVAPTAAVTKAPTAAVTTAPTVAVTTAPTVAVTTAPTAATAGTGNITYVISAFGIQFQCSNGVWTDFGLTMSVQAFFNGIGPNLPMAETGLPTIKFSWFINGAAAPSAALINPFNVANVVSTGNVVSFTLRDDQPTIGGTFQVGTCTQAQAVPAITVSMTSNTFIVGTGIAPTIPAVSGIPHIVNAFPAANNAGSVFNQAASTSTAASSSSSSSFASPQLVAAGVGIVAFGCIAGLAAIGIRRYKQRKNQDLPLLSTPKRESQTSVYVAQKE